MLCIVMVRYRREKGREKGKATMSVICLIRGQFNFIHYIDMNNFYVFHKLYITIICIRMLNRTAFIPYLDNEIFCIFE